MFIRHCFKRRLVDVVAQLKDYAGLHIFLDTRARYDIREEVSLSLQDGNAGVVRLEDYSRNSRS